MGLVIFNLLRRVARKQMQLLREQYLQEGSNRQKNMQMFEVLLLHRGACASYWFVFMFISMFVLSRDIFTHEFFPAQEYLSMYF